MFWGYTLEKLVINGKTRLKGDVTISGAKNAAVAIVNEDQSTLSRNISKALRQPYFQEPVEISYAEINEGLDQGKYSFVIVIPEHFQANLLAGKPTEIQLNIDATAISQGYIGSGYIKQIIMSEINTFLNSNVEKNEKPLFDQVIRVKYNPNLKSEWFMSVAQIIMMGTMLSIMLPAVALVREKESGTIEHLLVMPITPQEIMFSKIWSNSLIILFFAILSMNIVVKGYYGVHIQGSLILFFIGFMLFQFSVTSLGIVLSTFASNTAQLALSTIAVMMPMVFLSGAYTPAESMSPFMQKIMFFVIKKPLLGAAFFITKNYLINLKHFI